MVDTCKQAKLDGYEWVWVDTCCIDKRSSAELSEAINSMYWWYANAKICYTYLHDIDGRSSGKPIILGGKVVGGDALSWTSSFCRRKKLTEFST